MITEGTVKLHGTGYDYSSGGGTWVEFTPNLPDLEDDELLEIDCDRSGRTGTYQIVKQDDPPAST